MTASKRNTQARATRPKAAKVSSTSRNARSMAAQRSDRVQLTQKEAAKVGSSARITRSMTARRNDQVRATRGGVAKASFSVRVDRSKAGPRSEQARATRKKEAKVGSSTRFTRSMTAAKDDQARATRATAGEVILSTRVTRSMTPPRSDPFPLLKLPLELFENVLEACPQLGVKVTRLILAPPDGHQSDSPCSRTPLLVILRRILKHLPKLQHLKIRYWALQYGLPSLAELAPIFEKIKIRILTLDRCVPYGSDLKALLGTPLVAPVHTLLKESSILGTLVTAKKRKGDTSTGDSGRKLDVSDLWEESTTAPVVAPTATPVDDAAAKLDAFDEQTPDA